MTVSLTGDQWAIIGAVAALLLTGKALRCESRALMGGLLVAYVLPGAFLSGVGVLIILLAVMRALGAVWGVLR